MHKLKNKHTGEVITTPYMAEAQEYLDSGDYELMKSFDENSDEIIAPEIEEFFKRHYSRIIKRFRATKRKAQLDKEDF